MTSIPDVDLGRVRCRAFFLWENESGTAWWDPQENWLEAERYERQLVWRMRAEGKLAATAFRSVVPICKPQGGVVKHLGTGTLCMAGGRIFMITARHVVIDQINKSEPLYIASRLPDPATPGLPLDCVTSRQCTFPMPALVNSSRGDDYGYVMGQDIAILEISAKYAALPELGVRIMPISEITGVRRAAAGEDALGYGYPAGLTIPDPAQGIDRWHSCALWGKVVEGDIDGGVFFDPGYHLVVEVPEPGFPLNGMSGCPWWHFQTDPSGDAQPEIVGFFSSDYPARDGRTPLKLVPWWLPLWVLWSEYGEVRSELQALGWAPPQLKPIAAPGPSS